MELDAMQRAEEESEEEYDEDSEEEADEVLFFMEPNHDKIRAQEDLPDFKPVLETKFIESHL